MDEIEKKVAEKHVYERQDGACVVGYEDLRTGEWHFRACFENVPIARLANGQTVCAPPRVITLEAENAVDAFEALDAVAQATIASMQEDGRKALAQQALMAPPTPDVLAKLRPNGRG